MRMRLAVVVIVLSCVFLTTQAGPTSSAFSAVTANPSSTFASAASFGGCAYTPATITPVWMTGFEHGVTTAAASSGLLDIDWTASGTVSADSTVKRNGGYSMKIVRPSSDTVGRSRSVSSGMVVLRLAFRFNALPGGDLKDFTGVWSTNGNQLEIGYVSASQKVNLGFAGGTKRLSGTTISAGTWYVLDVRANYTVNPHTADWQLNAAAQTQATKSAAAEDPTEVWLGPDGGENVPLTMWFDDLLISQTSADYPVGDGKVLGLSPDAMGASSDPSGRLLNNDNTAWDASSWTKLTELPMTSTSTAIKQTVADGSAYVGISFGDTAETCANAVQAEVAYHSSSTTANVAKTSMMESGTERVVYSGAMNPNTTLTYRSAMISPASGTWNQTKVNGLSARIGFGSTIGAHPFWDALMVEYNVDL
jgi:hypothetical protein